MDQEHQTDKTHQFLRICGTCFKLYETGRPDDQEQRCDCKPLETQESWAGPDFNERACLCSCCGMELVESGSRWSAFFCRECQLLGMGVSLWERRLVFPVGRHSLMHTWVPAARTPSLAAHGGDTRHLAETVYETMKTIVADSDKRSEWSALVVSRHLRRLRLPGGTPVARYLRAMAKDEDAPTRWALFADFCEFIRTAPTA